MEKVAYSIEGGVAKITMDDGKANADLRMRSPFCPRWTLQDSNE
jgi:hypothetical protein